ncbi:MAG: hypothetical protein ACRELD_14905 [Longimicrobiales bacterium]
MKRAERRASRDPVQTGAQPIAAYMQRVPDELLQVQPRQPPLHFQRPRARLLLRTRAFLEWQSGAENLPRYVFKLITGADLVFVSEVSLWELRVKAAIGRISLPDFELSDLAAEGISYLPVRPLHIERAATYTDVPGAFTRLLLAQSAVERLWLIG